MSITPHCDLDTGRLAGHIRSRIESFDGDLRVCRIEGGQCNPTYIVDAEAGHAAPLGRNTMTH